MTAAAIQAIGLGVTFPGGRRALDAVNFDAPRGAVTVVVGPNGAGKTSLIDAAATLLLPSTGRLLVGGYDVTRRAHAVRRCIGLVPARQPGFHGRLSARENLRFFAGLHALPFAAAAHRIEDLACTWGLTDVLDERVDRLSDGMQTRLAIVRAAVHDPAIMLLDEPMRHLDQHWRQVFREWAIDRCRHGSRAVVLATHEPSMLDGVARVIVLRLGTVTEVIDDPDSSVLALLASGCAA